MSGFDFALDMHHVIDRGRSIILDVSGNRYFCLNASIHELILRWQVGQALGRADIARLDRLVEAGIMIRSDQPARPIRCPEVADRDYMSEAEPDDPTVPLLPLLWHLVMARSALRMLPFRAIISNLRRPGRVYARWRGADRTFSAHGLSIALERSGVLLSAHDRCLSRSIAVRWMLQHSGQPSEMIFGVIGQPFQAHCWVQSEGVVITDAVDHIRSFTPILAL